MFPAGSRGHGAIWPIALEWGVQVLDETAHQKLLAAIDVAVSKAIDVYNLASEGGDEELADFARAQVHQLQEFREAARARPTRRARWLSARTPRGDARAR